MITKESIRPGNLILFDHNEYRKPPKPGLRGIVEEVHEDGVLFKGGFKRRFDQLSGLELTDDLWQKFGLELVNRVHEDAWYHAGKDLLCRQQFRCVHDLQNWFEDKVGEKLGIKVGPNN
jgi:hypothetical protein